MKNLYIKNYLYHGIIDWLNYDRNYSRVDLCLSKLDSILNHGFIYRPCNFQKLGISHNDTANPYTSYFTFLACSPESIYASRFKKDIKEDNGFLVATSYSNFGILLDPRLLDELSLFDTPYCDSEIVIEDDISVSDYGVAIYVNPLSISENCFQIIKYLIKKYNYEYTIVSVFDGAVIASLTEERHRIKELALK